MKIFFILEISKLLSHFVGSEVFQPIGRYFGNSEYFWVIAIILKVYRVFWPFLEIFWGYFVKLDVSRVIW